MAECELCGGETPTEEHGHFPRFHSVSIAVHVDGETPLYWRKAVCCPDCFVKVGEVMAALQEGIDGLVARDPPSRAA